MADAPANPLSGDLAKDLSPTTPRFDLTGDLQKDLGAPASPSTPQGPLFSSPKGFYGPGVLANLESRFTGKTPQQAYEKRVPQLETAANVLASLEAPGRGVLRQALSQAGVGGGLEALKGTGPLRAVGKGIESGLGSLLGGAAGQAFIGQPVRQKAAAAATNATARAAERQVAEFAASKAQHAAKAAHDTEMTGAVNALEKQGFEASRRAMAQKDAANIAADLKKNVPALAPFTPDEKGLGDMLYGKGRGAVSRAFDKSLKDVMARHSGTPVSIPVEIADRYGVAHVGDKMAPKPLGRALEGPQRVTVSGGDLANAIVGTWRKDPKSYRIAADALIEAGVTDPNVAKAYKYWVGQLDYFNATKALKGEVFNPDAYRSGAVTKNVELLRRRGIGSLTEGPMNLVRPSPLAPTPREVPVQPPAPTAAPPPPPPDIRGIRNPIAGHPYIAAGAGSLAGHQVGGWPGAMLGTMGGLAAAEALPKQIITQAPGGNPGWLQMLIQALSKGGGIAGGSLLP